MVIVFTDYTAEGKDTNGPESPTGEWKNKQWELVSWKRWEFRNSIVRQKGRHERGGERIASKLTEKDSKN